MFNRTRPSRAAAAVLVLTATSVLAACGSGDEEGTGATQPVATDAAATTEGASDDTPAADLEVALVVGSTSDDFYAAIECGAKTRAEELGVELIIQGPNQFDATLQIPIVNGIAAREPDAIIIAPNDDTALFEPLQAMDEAGTEVVLVDTTLADASIAAGHIGSDYVTYGVQGADELVAASGESGKFLAIFAPPGVSTNDQGREGFTEAMSAYPGVEVLGFEISDGAAGASAAIVAATLAAHPDLTGVFTYNGGDAQGVVTALREAGRFEDVAFVSGDAQPFQVEQLAEGAVAALIVQQANTMGVQAVDYAVAAINGEDVPDETAIETLVARADNLEDPDVADNLYAGC